MLLELRKGSPFSKSMYCFGHLHRPVYLHVVISTKETIRFLNVSTNKTELRSLFLLGNSYRRFGLGLARKAKPLNTFLKNGSQKN